MKWSMPAIAALATAAAFSPVWHCGDGAAAAATPTPAALQYDEIVRTVIPPATPPAPGTFSADYAVAAAATPQPKPKMNFGMMFNQAAAKAYAEQMMQMANALHLARYTYYRGWIRRDDPIAQTATIEKCDKHQYVKLDLAKRTYSTIEQSAACATAPMQAPGPTGAPAQEAPGTVDVSASVNSTSLGPLTIDGIATTGWNRDVDVKMANATGSCRNAELKMGMQQYVSTIKVPHRFCPLPRGLSALAAAGATQGGCRPKLDTAGGNFDIDSAGLGVGASDNLVLFSTMSAGSGPRGQTMGFFIERGNVRWFGGRDAEALFEIPAGFTQAE